MRRSLLSLALLGSLLFILISACGKTDHLQGKAIYVKHCNNCHLEEGQGLRRLIPPLAGSDYLRERPADVVRGIRYGMEGPMVVNGITYNHLMPANQELSEFQIVNVVNYLNTAFGNDYPLITVPEARTWLAE